MAHLIIVATLDRPERLVAELVSLGIPPEKLVPLRRYFMPTTARS